MDNSGWDYFGIVLTASRSQWKQVFPTILNPKSHPQPWWQVDMDRRIVKEMGEVLEKRQQSYRCKKAIVLQEMSLNISIVGMETQQIVVPLPLQYLHLFFISIDCY